jgi:hypothetical protein
VRYRLCALLVAALAALATLAGCGQDDDPEGARQLWDKVNASPGFQSWSRAPGYATRKPSFSAHGNAVEIFVNPQLVKTLAGPHVATWPVGSIVVKEGFHGTTGSRKLVAVMEKRADGWFWAEFDDSGKSTYSGHPSVCLDCHEHRQGYSDWVYSFELPR